ncbi:MAG: glutaminyl-peptide cyclotransferase [Sphingobium sp.]|nr:glutaminyl-peptide cyclotransferase [Sphingobium sp.]
MIARLLLFVLLLWGTAARADIKWDIVRTLPHDKTAFTEGLFIADGLLYESTGLNGQSDFRAMNLKDGRILRRARLDSRYFGEGIVPWGDKMLSLTWQNEEGFIWQRSTFKKIGTFRYEGEGWGFTTDGKRLIMSDGTPSLRFLDPTNQKQTGTIAVTWQGQPVRYLNELEWANGVVYANVWYSPLIARINPKTGVISDWINLAPLVERNSLNPDMVLNGIAWDAKAKLLYVTGKNWPSIYVLRLKN